MSTPFNITILDVDKFIIEQRIQPVTSLLIYEPSNPKFHPDGLFSEEIFGNVGSEDRLTTYGYIELNTTILAPILYRTVSKLSNLYTDIMAGNAYATFNQITRDFERVSGDPEDIEGADTGYSFFMHHFFELSFKRTNSEQRETRLALIDAYRKIGLYNRYLVEPAGLRDLSNDDHGRMIQDDINKLYMTLLSYTSAIPPGSKSPLYDSVRYSIQLKALEIYDYIENIMIHKHGYLQGRWGHRRVAMGTRNVVSVANYSTSRPDDPQTLGPNETMAGTFQTAKSLQPLIVHGLKSIFIDPVFGDSASLTIPLINTKTYELTYQTITDEERVLFTSSVELEKWINRFRNIDIRDCPITIKSSAGIPYYLCMVYDQGDSIYLFRNLSDLRHRMSNKIELDNIHPITWIEALYLVTANAAMGRHSFITRYPVLGDTSCYPTKIHVASTIPARVVELKNLLDPDGPSMIYPEYPILGKPYLDTVVLGSARLGGLDADFDGDTVSFNAIMSDEANQEISEYLASPKSILDINKRLISGGSTEIIDMVLHNFSKAA